jgi:RNA polymerase sigma-70 factor (ECF subfamily)
MKSFPMRQQRVLELAFYEGLTHIEIAVSTGDPLDSVRAEIYRALLSIRNAMNSSARECGDEK